MVTTVSNSSYFNINQIDMQYVVDWIEKYEAVFDRFKTVSESGLLSIVQTQLQEIAPLLEEGQLLGQFADETQIIKRHVTPKLQALQNLYIAAERAILNNPEQLHTDSSIAEKWATLGFSDTVTTAVLENNADLARFLVESRMLFALVGFRETCGYTSDHNIRLDVDGEPLLKVQNQWVRWDILKNEIFYDSKAEKIKSQAYPGNITQVWGYFHPQGLLPIDGLNYDHVFPIYELNYEEYERTRQMAFKFYETHPEKDPGVFKDCIVQFYTSPRWQLPVHSPLLENANAQYPVHVGMRLITADRRVYSFGMRTLPEEGEFLLSNPLSTFMTTVEGKVAMLDQEEFRAHEGRIVTSIPLTSQSGDNILKFLNYLNKTQLRFQFTRQNCPVMALEILKRAGYTLDIRTDGPEFVYDMIPNLNQIPGIGPLIEKVENCVRGAWSVLPSFVTTPICWTKDAVLFVPKKMALFFSNLLFYKMGGSKKTIPLGEGTEEEEFYDKNGLQNFSSIIRSWSDLFKESTSRIYNSKPFIAWQKEQPSTFIEPYTGRPKLSIVPPAPSSS